MLVESMTRHGRRDSIGFGDPCVSEMWLILGHTNLQKFAVFSGLSAGRCGRSSARSRMVGLGSLLPSAGRRKAGDPC
jgi:hypothetical protein